jgi:hypothetical protein
MTSLQLIAQGRAGSGALVPIFENGICDVPGLIRARRADGA